MKFTVYSSRVYPINEWQKWFSVKYHHSNVKKKTLLTPTKGSTIFHITPKIMDVEEIRTSQHKKYSVKKSKPFEMHRERESDYNRPDVEQLKKLLKSYYGSIEMELTKNYYINISAVAFFLPFLRWYFINNRSTTQWSRRIELFYVVEDFFAVYKRTKIDLGEWLVRKKL